MLCSLSCYCSRRGLPGTTFYLNFEKFLYVSGLFPNVCKPSPFLLSIVLFFFLRFVADFEFRIWLPDDIWDVWALNDCHYEQIFHYTDSLGLTQYLRQGSFRATWPQHDGSAPCVIAQQYSSATFVSLLFYSRRGKFGVYCKSDIVSIVYFLKKMRKSEIA
jgi:hypothetical protein